MRLFFPFGLYIRLYFINVALMSPLDVDSTMASRNEVDKHLQLNTPVNGQQRAPVYSVPDRGVVAIEHPMIVKNIDKALKTFGTNRPFRRILDSDDPEECLPLYLRPNDPMAVPILSHNGTTNNVLVQVTVPKKTGRKRKKGSQDPYIQSVVSVPLAVQSEPGPVRNIRSQSRLDSPAELLRTLKDNVDRYDVKVVGHISQTHRFRGLSDFHQSTSHGAFMPRLRDTMLTGDVTKFRNFAFDQSMTYEKNEEVMPPPAFTGHTMPFNWAWLQNPNIFEETDKITGERVLINHSKPAEANGAYVAADANVVANADLQKLPDEPSLRALVIALQEAFEERPIWTRRGLANRFGDAPWFYLLRHGQPYVGYQFKGGPFRDAIIKHGVDPRVDSSYRQYQTLFFKMPGTEEKEIGTPWQERKFSAITSKGPEVRVPTHLFDGQNLTLDGKVWQICDITDPLLMRVIHNAPSREKFEPNSDGWFTNGTMAKIRCIMKCKLLAIRTGKEVQDEGFRESVAVPDIIPGDKLGRLVHVPVPDLGITEEEKRQLAGDGNAAAVGQSGMRRRIQKRRQSKKARAEEARSMSALKRAPKPKPLARSAAGRLSSDIWGADGSTQASSGIASVTESATPQPDLGARDAGRSGMAEVHLDTKDNEQAEDEDGNESDEEYDGSSADEDD